MARVAADENLHYLFYRDVSDGRARARPVEDGARHGGQVRDFEMPGTGIDGFRDHAKAIARAGIYDLAIHHDQILVPVVLRHWQLEALEGLTPEAEAARASLLRRIRAPTRSPAT